MIHGQMKPFCVVYKSIEPCQNLFGGSTMPIGIVYTLVQFFLPEGLPSAVRDSRSATRNSFSAWVIGDPDCSDQLHDAVVKLCLSAMSIQAKHHSKVLHSNYVRVQIRRYLADNPASLLIKQAQILWLQMLKKCDHVDGLLQMLVTAVLCLWSILSGCFYSIQLGPIVLSIQNHGRFSAKSVPS